MISFHEGLLDSPGDLSGCPGWPKGGGISGARGGEANLPRQNEPDH